jgi:hypothetical protein
VVLLVSNGTSTFHLADPRSWPTIATACKRMGSSNTICSEEQVVSVHAQALGKTSRDNTQQMQ